MPNIYMFPYLSALSPSHDKLSYPSSTFMLGFLLCCLPSPSCRRFHQPASDTWAPPCSTHQKSGFLPRWTAPRQHQPAINQSIIYSFIHSQSCSHHPLLLGWLCAKVCCNEPILPKLAKMSSPTNTIKMYQLSCWGNVIFIMCTLPYHLSQTDPFYIHISYY